MTDNPSGSTGQNVTAPANAPAGDSDSSDREWLSNLIHDDQREQCDLDPEGFYDCEQLADRILAAGFTRAQHDGERVAPTINRVAPGGSRPWTDTEQVRLAAQAMRDADFSTDQFDVYQAINVLAVQRDAAIARAEAAEAKLAQMKLYADAADRAFQGRDAILPGFVRLGHCKAEGIVRLAEAHRAGIAERAALAEIVRKNAESAVHYARMRSAMECIANSVSVKHRDAQKIARAALAGNGTGA